MSPAPPFCAPLGVLDGEPGVSGARGTGVKGQTGDHKRGVARRTGWRPPSPRTAPNQRADRAIIGRPPGCILIRWTTTAPSAPMPRNSKSCYANGHEPSRCGGHASSRLSRLTAQAVFWPFPSSASNCANRAERRAASSDSSRSSTVGNTLLSSRSMCARSRAM